MTDKELHTKQLINSKLIDATSGITSDRFDAMQRATARHNSPLSKLQRRYLVSGIIGITGPTWIILLNSMEHISDLLFWIYTVYVVFIGIANLILYSRLRKVPELMSRPIVEAQCSMLRLDSMRRWLKYIGWIFGIPVVILIFRDLAQVGNDVIWGGIVGGVIGGIIGLTWEIKIRRQMRALLRVFESTD